MRREAALAAALLGLTFGAAFAQNPTEPPAASPATAPARAETPRPDDQAFLRGMQAKSRRQTAEALREFSAAADTGHTEAQYVLGLQYLRGDGVKADPARARDWFLRALEQNHPLAAAQDHWDAQHRLGKMLRDGRAGEFEYHDAVRLFAASAKGGNSYAKISLGELYETGRGVTRDLKRARELYTQAAREGEPAARQKLAQLGRAPAPVAQASPRPAGKPRAVLVASHGRKRP